MEQGKLLEFKIVVLRLAGESFGVEITSVREIGVMQEITPVPKTPPFVEGIINLRGSVIPIIDLRARLALPRKVPDKDTRIIIAEMERFTVGMVVDAVTEVLTINREMVEEPSPVIANMDTAFMAGVAKLDQRLIILLDLERVLDLSEKKALGEVCAELAQV